MHRMCRPAPTAAGACCWRLLQALALSCLVRLVLRGVNMTPTCTAAVPHLRSLVAKTCGLQADWLSKQTSLQSLALSKVTTTGDNPDLTPVLETLVQLTCLALRSQRPWLAAAATTLSNLQRLYVDPWVHPGMAPLQIAGPSLNSLRWLCASSEALMRCAHLLRQAAGLRQLDMLHVQLEGADSYDSLAGDWQALCSCVGDLPFLESLTVFFDRAAPPPPFPYSAALLSLQRRRPTLAIEVTPEGDGTLWGAHVVDAGWLEGADAAE